MHPETAVYEMPEDHTVTLLLMSLSPNLAPSLKVLRTAVAAGGLPMTLLQRAIALKIAAVGIVHSCRLMKMGTTKTRRT